MKSHKLKKPFYHCRLNNKTDLTKVVFYDIVKQYKLFNELVDKREGGVAFWSNRWAENMFELADKHIYVIEAVKFFAIAEIYKFNYVYVISGTHNGTTKYKIGKANSIKERLKRFEVKIPFDIDLITSFSVKDAINLESELHKTFKNKRLSGEWFDLTAKNMLKIIEIGSNRELHDYYLTLDEHLDFLRKDKWLNDKDYIKYLEQSLVFNGIKFNARI
jgi:hypothetical protein